MTPKHHAELQKDLEKGATELQTAISELQKVNTNASTAFYCKERIPN